ncbi:hypothetical protein [Streptomyces dysideae]|uniref:Lipoprotein n=1 Tax=Streptomyces dysideae TaxID=909626 RepID=A0A101V390_9ACTN|nr:hypothetical protein [Streptomyces dysideae]KUO21671.1 hypothetical protein AQJ91_07795 [Streptomyces dysideae]
MRDLRGAAAAFLVAAVLTGCSGSTDEGKPVESGQPDSQSPQAAPAKPRTVAEFLARAEAAMAAEQGWTFEVKGREGLVLRGQENAATYTATVHRTTGDPWALRSTGASRGRSGAKPEEIYVVDGTAYVKEGTAAWKQGPLSDPEFADKVEDPLAALDAFRGYGDEITLSEPDGPDGRVELRVRTATAPLTGVRDEGVVQKALREFTPTLEQLRAAGVSASESRITVAGVEESFVLDATTYRVTAHTFKCTFLIPYEGQRIRYDQEVTERNSGTYEGTVALPEGVG